MWSSNSCDISEIIILIKVNIYNNNMLMMYNVMKIGILHKANEHNNLKTVRLLLYNGIDPNETHSWHGGTALHCFSYGKDVEMIRLLLQYGADVNIVNKWDRSPLHYACWYGAPLEIVQLLIEYGANIHDVDQWGDTALHDVCLNSTSNDIIEHLLMYGADPTILNSSGRTPIDMTVDWNIQNHIRKYAILHKLKEWRPWNHSKYPIKYRRAMQTLALLAKTI